MVGPTARARDAKSVEWWSCHSPDWKASVEFIFAPDLTSFRMKGERRTDGFRHNSPSSSTQKRHPIGSSF